MHHSISRMFVAVAAAVALVSTGSGATAIGKKPETDLHQQQQHHVRGLQTYTASDNYQLTMLNAVNAERAAVGLAALCANKKLQTAAQLHSQDQATNNFMGHTGSNGSTMAQRITAQGFQWTNIGENVAAGQVDVAAVMKAWMGSSGHKANILSTKYTFFGTGYAYNAKATYKHYWTQDFGTGSKEVCNSSGTVTQTSTPTPAPTTASPAVQQTSAPTVTPASTTLAPTTATPASTTTTPQIQQTATPVTSAPTTPKPTTVAPATPAPTTATPSAGLSMQAQMLNAVNAERAAVGLAAFCTNTKLQTAAQLHSEDQAKNNFMDHTGSDGSTMDQRVTAQGFVWTGVAENVAAGQVDVTAVVKSWMASPGHKANILGNYKFFGMGYGYNAASTYKYYWTQDFGTGSKEVCA
ncbi:hypothetical protein Gpo141_00009133 [Globisporangium polare]